MISLDAFPLMSKTIEARFGFPKRDSQIEMKECFNSTENIAATKREKDLKNFNWYKNGFYDV